MEKFINWITLGPLKGSRSKFGVLLAGIVLLLEHFTLVPPGTITENGIAVKIFALLQSYFVIEHFEK